MDSSTTALLAPYGSFGLVLLLGLAIIRNLLTRLDASEKARAEAQAARITDLQSVLPALTQASAAMTESSRALTRFLERGP